MSPYISIFFFFLVAGTVVAALLFLAASLGPKNRTFTKQLPFECGAAAVGSVQQQRFNVSFYLIAVLFLVFDLEVAFMYPWAVVLDELGWPGFVQMCGFILVLAAGLIYAWGRGVFEWNK